MAAWNNCGMMCASLKASHWSIRTGNCLNIHLQHLRNYCVTSLLRRHSAATNAAAAEAITFVPRHQDTSTTELAEFERVLRRFPRLAVITGAGISTESGVPDYRSAEVGLYARRGHRPITYQEFVSSEPARRRYWARNFAGWPRFSSVQPNAAHHALADWQRRGRCSSLVTQNVDGLHSAAAGGEVTELHGSAHRVRCLGCDFAQSRHQLQRVLERANPQFAAEAPAALRPDGDVELDQDQVSRFVVPPCPDCGGLLMPDIVFFGDSVPRARVDSVRQAVADADALLVVGSSLHVYSAYRHVLQAVELDRPVLILNIGPTRGDKHAFYKLDGRAGLVLPRLRL
ncbi:NAD-dependent protein lipoamidase sirtuin-4, mitochondrial [Amphibalanus amphitrite]|uniref:NAD-dependent protein deacylase n=1 Tax=Amphibalanus amphitrite TaxID=1232801 RepID=A0A6A4XB25_AMPAM|nr:NAD-dependent protein lipoamidase sirtuin-4, mitochondrial [Amphibalanus amphitrite]